MKSNHHRLHTPNSSYTFIHRAVIINHVISGCKAKANKVTLMQGAAAAAKVKRLQHARLSLRSSAIQARQAP